MFYRAYRIFLRIFWEKFEVLPKSISLMKIEEKSVKREYAGLQGGDPSKMSDKVFDGSPGRLYAILNNFNIQKDEF